MDVTILHNPACGTSRNTLAIIRSTGIEPTIIPYLETPPTRAELKELVSQMGVSLRDIIRQKGTPYDDLGLGDASLTDDELLDAIERHPIMINRPIVITPKGVKLCRPSELVFELLDVEPGTAFIKEDGERVVATASSACRP